MSRILITGGGGFLGSRLAERLRERDRDAQVTLLDVAFPPGFSSRFPCVAGDVASRAVIESAMGGDTASIFHLAAVVSGGAEADFDLGYRVNMDGTRHLLEACRKLAKPPKIVYASSVAAFGGVLPEVLDDSTTPRRSSRSASSSPRRRKSTGAIRRFRGRKTTTASSARRGSIAGATRRRRRSASISVSPTAASGCP